MIRDDVPEASTRGIQGQAFDIQAIVASGFHPLPYCDYHLLRVVDADAVRAWLATVLDAGLVKSVADLGGHDEEPRSATRRKRIHEQVAALAFSFEGLAALGVRESADFPFPTPFGTGMTSAARARLLGDDGVDDWLWGDTRGERRPVVHCLAAHYRATRDVGPGSPFADLASHGWVEVLRVGSCPSYIEHDREDGRLRWRSYEPFGFRDGIAQPIVDGLRAFHGRLDPAEPSTPGAEDTLVKPGEFVLGHATEYGERAYCPDVAGWRSRPLPDGQASTFGVNGSYLVVRQIAQDVATFRRFEAAQAVVAGEPTPAERMIGRRKDGTPLLTCPVVPEGLDDFNYRAVDADGFQCPRGSHVRRANPRDTLGWGSAAGVAASKLHRLLRRGRVYSTACRHDAQAGVPTRPAQDAAQGDGDAARGAGVATTDADPRLVDGTAAAPCRDARHRAACGRGIFFLALNAHLERQFELVQKRWIANDSFADLAGQSDPLLGAGEPPRRFSVPAIPVGMPIGGFAAFTRVEGGGYFFVPSLTALAFLARPRERSDART